MAPHPSPTNPPDFFLQKFIKVDLCIWWLGPVLTAPICLFIFQFGNV
jgi:hypothetical protein